MTYRSSVSCDSRGCLCVMLLWCSANFFFFFFDVCWAKFISFSDIWLTALNYLKKKKKGGGKQKTLNPVHLPPCFFSVHATNFSRNIHLSLLMMSETPHSQEWWPEWPSKPVCHYCWPVAHFYLPMISRPPWEEAAGSREGEGAKGVWEAEIERQEKQGWRVVGEVRGQQQALRELREEKR